MTRPPLPPGPYVVAGAGVAGQAAAAELADRAGADSVTVWAASAPPPSQAEGVERVAGRGVSLRIGGDGLDLLPAARCVVKSPGIPDDEPIVAAAAAAGLALIDEAELGWRLDPRPYVGVTGTNGKSTVCSLVATALSAAGAKPLVAGNCEGGPALSAAAADRDADAIVAELSSFQLRHSPELLPDVAVLTNCTQDSWHRHAGREGYARDKARIALRAGAPAPHAVLPTDDPLGVRLAAEVAAAGGAVTTFGMAAGADCRVVDCDWDLDTARLTLAVDGSEIGLSPRLPGPHNALNVVAALAAARAFGVDLDTAAAAIERAEPVPARLERIPGSAPFDLLVDYAHNPDGLLRVLEAVRHVQERRRTGRLVTVVSALPVFDEDQYAEMGRVVGRLADVVIATTERLSSDAPLEEPPAFFGALRDAADDLAVEPDRRAAVELAVARAQPGDVVLVLGRGRRRTPIHLPGGDVLRSDDRELAAHALAERAA